MDTGIKESLETLDSILAEHIEAHKRLSSAAAGLKRALVDCDHDAIVAATRDNERVASEIRALENKRIELVAGFGVDDSPGDSFTSLEARFDELELDEETKGILDSVRDKRAVLGTLIHEIDHQNQLNITLISQALEFHDFSLKLLWNAARGESTGYSPEGDSYSKETSGLFDGVA